jgi:hypothetical protein
MRHLLPFDGTRAAARLAALFVLVALLVVGSIRTRSPSHDPRTPSPASRVTRGTPGLFLLGESSHR